MNIHRSPPELAPSNKNSLELNQIFDLALFLPWPEQDQLLESIHRLTDNAAEVMLALGPSGAGKTTFAYRICNQAPDHWLLCRIDAHPLLHIYQLLQDIAQQIDLNLELMPENAVIEESGILTTPQPPAFLDETYLANKIHQHFSNLRLQGQLPVILIDDADLLPAATLAYLLQLHERIIEELHAFTLILLAQPILDTTLTADDGYVGGTSNFHHLDLPRVTDEQIKAYAAHFLLMNGIRRNPRWKPERFITINQQAQGLPSKINLLIKSALLEDTNSPRTSLLEGILWLFTGMICMSVFGFGILQLASTQELINKWFNHQFQPDMKSGWISKTLPLPLPKPIMTQPSVLPPILPPVSTVTPTLPPVTNTPPAIATNKQPVATAEPPLPAPRHAWLLKQPVTNYTLQINHAGSVDEAEHYIARNHLETKAFFIETIEKGKPAYFVLHGTYATRAEANAALSKLPSNLRKKKPFPVSFKKFQTAIKKHY